MHDLEDYMDYKTALANRVRQARTEVKQMLTIEGSQEQQERYRQCNKLIDE
jgi:hypothetical protein